jgi:hypothetical protein
MSHENREHNGGPGFWFDSQPIPAFSCVCAIVGVRDRHRPPGREPDRPLDRKPDGTPPDREPDGTAPL